MTAIIITVIISVVVGVAWAHSIAEADPDRFESTFDAQAWEDYANNFDPQDLLDKQEEMLRGE